MKEASSKSDRRAICSLFQSPCGEAVMKGEQHFDIPMSIYVQFQSPCGEAVMKDAMLDMSEGFVTVSVPLRGSGDERVMKLVPTACPQVFQSPCGEAVMKEWQAVRCNQPRCRRFSPLAGKR